jgi:hypothetical protein
LFSIRFFREEVFMTVKRFSTLFCQLMGMAMFASLSIWSSSTFAACNNVVTSGLIACYPFDGNANDASGNNLHGSVMGTTLTVDRAGTSGKAYYFDGNSYINMGNSPKLDVNYHTITAWVKPEPKLFPTTGSNAWKSIVGKVTPLVYETLSLVLKPTNQLTTGFATSGEGNHLLESPSAIPDGQWNFVALTYDGTKVVFYMNGAIDSSHPRSGTVRTNTNNLAIGRHGGDANQLDRDSFFKGAMDDVRIYNRALTDAEVKQLYNEANPEPVVCKPANYTNGVLQVPSITIDGVTDTYKATMLQYNSGFAFRVTQSSIITGKSSCPATYSPTTGFLHIPLVKTKSAIPLNTFQCYDVTMQAFSDRFQLDLDSLKVVKCP